MSITCQVTQLKADRICLHVPDIAAQPETSQFLMQYLLGLPGVAGVEIRPANSSAVILHDGKMKTRAAILDALRGKQPAAGLQSADDVVQDDRAGESISQASEATSQADDRAYRWATDVLFEVRKQRSEAKQPMRVPISRVTVRADPSSVELMSVVEADLRSALRVQAFDVSAGEPREIVVTGYEAVSS